MDRRSTDLEFLRQHHELPQSANHVVDQVLMWFESEPTIVHAKLRVRCKLWCYPCLM